MHSASGLQGCLCHPTGELLAARKPIYSMVPSKLFMPMDTVTMLMTLLCVLAALVAGAPRRRLQTCSERCSHSALLGKSPAWHRSLPQCVLSCCPSHNHSLSVHRLSLTSSCHLLLTSILGILRRPC